MMHVGLGREHPLHVEYIHIGAALSVIQDILTEAILSHPRLHISRKIAIVKALGKVIWIQNDLFAKWYVRDGEEYGQGTEDVVIEKEGYLHGKKILEDEDVEEEEDGEDVGRAPGVCPFSGLAKGVQDVHIDAAKGERPSEAAA